MAKMKKATVKKTAPKKMVKKPVQKETPAPVPTQQTPQPPMGTPPIGANGPMMRKGGKIKKAANGATITTTTDKTTKKSTYETSPFTKAKQNKQNKQNKEDKYKNLGGEIGRPTGPKGNRIAPTLGGAKSGKTMKKAQGGSSFAALAPPYDKATFADKIAGAKKNAGKAKSGGSIKKAQGGYTGEPGLAERAGPMVKSKTKVRSSDGNYVTKQVTTSKPNSNKSTTKTRRTLQGFINGAPRVNDLKNGGKMKTCKDGC